jgi:prevent-host-death family protein
VNTIAVSELRSNLMRILRDIEHGSTVEITSRGKVVAKLIPPDDSRVLAKKRLAELSKTAIVGDVITSVDTEWKLLRQ